MSKDYVEALELHLPFNVPKTVTHVFIAAQDSDDMIPFGRENVHIVRADVKLMNKILGANKHNLKGIVFKRLCDVVCRKGLQVFDEVSQYPQRIVRRWFEIVMGDSEVDNRSRRVINACRAGIEA